MKRVLLLIGILLFWQTVVFSLSADDCRAGRDDVYAVSSGRNHCTQCLFLPLSDQSESRSDGRIFLFQSLLLTTGSSNEMNQNRYDLIAEFSEIILSRESLYLIHCSLLI